MNDSKVSSKFFNVFKYVLKLLGIFNVILFEDFAWLNIEFFLLLNLLICRNLVIIQIPCIQNRNISLNFFVQLFQNDIFSNKLLWENLLMLDCFQIFFDRNRFCGVIYFVSLEMFWYWWRRLLLIKNVYFQLVWVWMLHRSYA